MMAAALAASAIIWSLLPPAPIPLPAATRDPRVIAGVLHVHSSRSDGTASPAQIAAAAAAAGLEFVILADHGDGTREPEAPAYLSRVLVIDGVEISTNQGHYVGIGMRRAPYPIAGDADAVVEDVARLGGLGIAAHPVSPKAGLAWTDWNARFDGVEWLNGDAEWRDEGWGALARSGATYFLRPAASVARVLDRPTDLLARLDRIARERDVLIVAGTDAHGGAGAEGQRRIPIPSYRSMFQSFAVRVSLRGALRGDARHDMDLLLDGLRHRRVYTAIDAVAGPARVTFTAQSGRTRAEMGGRLAAAGQVTLRVRSNGPPGTTIELLRDGKSMATAPIPDLERAVDHSLAAYRVEVHVPGSPGEPPVPWVLTNAIVVGRGEDPAPSPSADIRPRIVLLEPGDRSRWSAEHDPTSHADVSAAPTGGGGALSLTFTLGLDAGASPYAAIVRDVPSGLAACGTLVLTVSANREMRASVQVREPGGDTPALGQRWRRSIYVPTTPRTVTLPLSELRAVPGASRKTPMPGAVRSVLLVVDTVNARAGEAGVLRVHRAGCS
jgi:predicted metal-dependent phosphoesterase TrpH